MNVELLEDRVLLAQNTLSTALIAPVVAPSSLSTTSGSPIVAPLPAPSTIAALTVSSAESPSGPFTVPAAVVPISVPAIVVPILANTPAPAAVVSQIPTNTLTGPHATGVPLASSTIDPGVNADPRGGGLSGPSLPSIGGGNAAGAIGVSSGDVPIVPRNGSVEVQGVLDSNHTTETLATVIPPGVSSVAIKLTPQDDAGGKDVPLVTRVFLVDSLGRVVSQWVFSSGPDGDGPGIVKLPLTAAPFGGLLLVEVSTEITPNSSESQELANGSNSTIAGDTQTAAAKNRESVAVTVKGPDSDSTDDSTTLTVNTSPPANGAQAAGTGVGGTAGGGGSVSVNQPEIGSGATTASGNGDSSNLGNASGVTGSGQQSATWTLPFVLDIQLQPQNGPTTPTTATSDPGQDVVGILSVSSTLPSSSATNSLSSLTTSDTSIGATTSAGPVTDSSTTAQTMDSVDGFNERVPTGPLASRSAGPLGPIIAASMMDPTSPIDRHERALSQDMDGNESDDETATPYIRGDLVNVELDGTSALAAAPRPSETDDDHSLVVEVTGGGGFPLKVTATPRRQRADLAALLAVLPETSHSKPEIPLASGEDRILDEIALELTAPTAPPIDHPRLPEYAKAAGVAAVVLGLTSGPLFPDLMRLLRGRKPSLLVGRRHPGRGRRPNAPDSNA